jgi:hypothetical protein
VAITQDVKKKKEIEALRTLPKPKVKKRKSLTTGRKTAKATDKLKPISKSKEWRLLYRPYPFKTTANGSSPLNNENVDYRVKGKNSEQFKGLCKNCKKHKTCTLPRPEGGVWRCEEYE